MKSRETKPVGLGMVGSKAYDVVAQQQTTLLDSNMLRYFAEGSQDRANTWKMHQ